MYLQIVFIPSVALSTYLAGALDLFGQLLLVSLPTTTVQDLDLMPRIS